MKSIHGCVETEESFIEEFRNDLEIYLGGPMSLHDGLSKEMADKVVKAIFDYNVANRCTCESGRKTSSKCMMEALQKAGLLRGGEEKSKLDHLNDLYETAKSVNDSYASSNKPLPMWGFATLQVIYDAAIEALQEEKLEKEKLQKYIKEALKLVQQDPHNWSDRPCPTCQIITDLFGKDFGCVKHAKELKRRKENAY